MMGFGDPGTGESENLPSRSSLPPGWGQIGLLGSVPGSGLPLWLGLR